MSGAGATAGSRPVLLPLSVCVSLHLPRAIVSGSLYGVLTRFRELTLPVCVSPLFGRLRAVQRV